MYPTNLSKSLCHYISHVNIIIYSCYSIKQEYYANVAKKKLKITC